MLHAYEVFLVKVEWYGNVLARSYNPTWCLVTDGTWFKKLWEFDLELVVGIEFSQ